MLRIIADENMPHARTFFSRLGMVETVSGRSIRKEMVKKADALLVRSVTSVNEALLKGTNVSFVGTATIGTDHVDQAWLSEQGIGFASAPGCNAESVANYMASALVFAAGRMGWTLSECVLGIVGVGNCGSRVERVGRALGMEVRLNDPPLARATGKAKYRPLEELLDCDVLALHVPLTREGPDPTWRLIDEGVLKRMKPGTVVINACRGFVLDEGAALQRLAAGRLGGLILDAWENEPNIHPNLLRAAMLGTPHIAGYSYDGKLNGTRMIYEAACRHFGRPPETVRVEMPQPAVEHITVRGGQREFDAAATEVLMGAYPVLRDDAALRRAAAPDPEAVGPVFDRLRKTYPVRREFEATNLRLIDAPANWTEQFSAMGFHVEKD